ncbi:MAG: adenylyltransferase/cytidyltransferase family protein, partial [Muribaculum sp.]|nr:adenylyltransferase/cytidyltransferase family protein [Muribaculum sp.]
MTPRSREHIAFYAGSFDPFTLGHFSVVRRATALFDRVIVAVGVNESKLNSGDIEDRLSAIRRATKSFGDRVVVMSYTGLTVDAARSAGATCLLRGVRNTSD